MGSSRGGGSMPAQLAITGTGAVYSLAAGNPPRLADNVRSCHKPILVLHFGMIVR